MEEKSYIAGMIKDQLPGILENMSDIVLVKLLVASMEGRITVKSKEGLGSTFTLMLPLHKPSKNETAGNSVVTGDSRLIQEAAIEFSNIYL